MIVINVEAMKRSDLGYPSRVPKVALSQHCLEHIFNPVRGGVAV
jgi:hypothetical protein